MGKGKNQKKKAGASESNDPDTLKVSFNLLTIRILEMMNTRKEIILKLSIAILKQ